MPKVFKASLWFLVLLTVAAASYYAYVRLVGNPRVMTEIRAEPDGERARRVMLIELPDGRTLPVNYLREDDMVYMGVDGLWWRQFREQDMPVELVVRGEVLRGRARAVLDDPASARQMPPGVRVVEPPQRECSRRRQQAPGQEPLDPSLHHSEPSAERTRKTRPARYSSSNTRSAVDTLHAIATEHCREVRGCTKSSR